MIIQCHFKTKLPGALRFCQIIAWYIHKLHTKFWRYTPSSASISTDNYRFKKSGKLRNNLACDVLRIRVKILRLAMFFFFISQNKSQLRVIFPRFAEHEKMPSRKYRVFILDFNSCSVMWYEYLRSCLICLMVDDHLCMTEH